MTETRVQRLTTLAAPSTFKAQRTLERKSKTDGLMQTPRTFSILRVRTECCIITGVEELRKASLSQVIFSRIASALRGHAKRI